MKTKALISFAVTAKLICVFGFAYAECWFSHEAAQLLGFHYIFFFSFFIILFYYFNNSCKAHGFTVMPELQVRIYTYLVIDVCKDSDWSAYAV